MTCLNQKISSPHRIAPDEARPSLTLTGLQSGAILPSQLKAARGLLSWDRREFAKASGLSPETIKNVEQAAYTPQETTCDALVKAFATHGVEFIYLINFHLHTLSGNQLDMIVNVAGVVQVMPVSQSSITGVGQ